MRWLIIKVLSTSEEERSVSVRVNRSTTRFPACATSCVMDTPDGRRVKEVHESRHLCGPPPRARPRATPHDAQVAPRRTRVAFLKLDVQFADEDELLAQEFGIPTKKVYTASFVPTIAT